MKFVMVFGFFSAIFFNGFNFGQAFIVEDVQPQLAQLFIYLVDVIGTRVNQSNTNEFNTPSITYETMEDLTAAAETKFNPLVNYFSGVNYYKNKGDEEQYNGLETALNIYVNFFSGEIASLKVDMLKIDTIQEEEENVEDDSSDWSD